MQEHENQARKSRKKMYYAGMALTGFGFILVLSVVFSFIAIIARLDTPVNPFTAIIRALIAMMTIGAGQFMIKVGKGEFSGSDLGLEASPAGELATDAAAALGSTLGDNAQETLPFKEKAAVSVRCAQCQQLNEAQAENCISCGGVLVKEQQ